ncbi:Deuterolysin metalloprotease family-domain-containing protein [Hypoxylon fuscum]|nr:Deuterolysin metalloprotease family-domain-containing protein [Hypoxylon fuscum]
MRYAQILLALASLTATIDAHILRPVHSKRTSTLEVTLAPATSNGAAELVATIRNVGSTDLNLLKVGTLLDEVLPVQKVLAVDEKGVEVQFRGIHASIRYDALTAKHFQLLKASESVSTVISAAAVHEFVKSGTYTFSVSGLMPVAPAGSTELSGPALTIQSNSVSLQVDTEAAAAVPKTSIFHPLQERTNIQDNCNATQLAASTEALANCKTLALAAAADAADPSSARFVEYFRTNSSDTRQTVVDRLTAAAKECSTTDSGVSLYYCNDNTSICESEGPLNAYTRWDLDYVVMCPLFYDTLPPLPLGCHRQCQATTTLHEMTHCEDVYSPHTNDFTYGYNESVALTPEFALLNADNYSLYANAVYMKC